MDIEKFTSAPWKSREAFVAIPELAPFFEVEVQAAVDEWEAESRSPVDDETRARIVRETVGFRVRGLSGQEFGIVKKNADERRDIMAIVDGLLSRVPDKIKASIRSLYAADTELSPDDALSMYLLEKGIVWPELPPDRRMEIVTGLHRHLPIDFRTLAMKVLHLTGQGSEPGKPMPSTGNPA